jgi:hypothetical protein
LAALLSNPVSAIATIGATATGLSIYVGVENSIWLYKKVTMALSKPDPSPTGLEKPGQSADDQARDPEHAIFFTYEIAKAGDIRSRFVYASTVAVSSYEALHPDDKIKGMIAFLEQLSPLQIGIWGDDYWQYSNAVVLRILDLGPVSSMPQQVPVAFYDCLSWGWNMSPLKDVRAESLSNGTLSWKLNVYFGWNPTRALFDSDFDCERQERTINTSALVTGY